MTRAAVDPNRRPIRLEDIGRASDSDVETGGGLPTPPPHRWIRSGVVRVVPDRLRQTLPKEGEPAAQLIGGGVGGLRPAQLLGVDIELVHGRNPSHITALRVVDGGEQSVRVGEERRINEDAVGVGPGRRSGRSGANDHRTTKRGRARCRHRSQITRGGRQIRHPNLFMSRIRSLELRASFSRLVRLRAAGAAEDGGGLEVLGGVGAGSYPDRAPGQ